MIKSIDNAAPSEGGRSGNTEGRVGVDVEEGGALEGPRREPWRENTSFKMCIQFLMHGVGWLDVQRNPK